MNNNINCPPWLVVALLALISLTPGGARSEVVTPAEVGFRVDPQTYLPDGRFHASVWAEVPTIAHRLRIDSVIWTGDSVEVEITAERTDFESPIPPSGSWTHAISLHIEDLPPGQYPIRVNEQEVDVEVPNFPKLRDPVPMRLWPAAPALHDPVWLITEAPYACATFSLALLQAVPEMEQARVIVDFDPAECKGAPRLHAIPLGTFEPGSYRMAVEFTVDSRDGNPNPRRSARETAYLQLQVAEHSSPRLGGAWYDPAQSGQGITIEFHSDQVLLYWYTFDADGAPVWLMAHGENQDVLMLDVVAVTGGAFPPALDPDQVSHVPWGSIEIAFEDCETGSMQWTTSQPGFTSGESPLVRLSGPSGFRCDQGPTDDQLRPDWYQDPATHFRLSEAE